MFSDNWQEYYACMYGYLDYENKEDWYTEDNNQFVELAGFFDIYENSTSNDNLIQYVEEGVKIVTTGAGNPGKYISEWRKIMLKDSFVKVYSKFRLHFYSKFFEGVQDREVSLTTVETFCMEIIYSMNNPTVNEFAKLANISSPNAAYKINHLIKKGYLRKVQSENDKREYHLEVTDKYLSYYQLSNQYIAIIMKRLEERFSKDELETLEKILNVMSDELMTEIDI